MTDSKYDILVDSYMDVDSSTSRKLVYSFRHKVSGEEKSVGISVSAFNAMHDGWQDQLRVKVRGVAALVDVDPAELWKMTVRVLVGPVLPFLMCRGAGKPAAPTEWNGDVKAPPTEAEIARALKEMGLEDFL